MGCHLWLTVDLQLSVAVPVPEEHIQAALDIEHSQEHQEHQDQEGCQHCWHVPCLLCQDREGHGEQHTWVWCRFAPRCGRGSRAAITLLNPPHAPGLSMEFPLPVPSRSLPACCRVNVAVTLLIQQANTPKSASWVRLSCRTLARSCSEEFWPDLMGHGDAVGRAVW